MNTMIVIDPDAGGGIAYQHAGHATTALPRAVTEGEVAHLLRQLAVDPANTVAVEEDMGGYGERAQPASRTINSGRNFRFILCTSSKWVSNSCGLKCV